MSINHWLWLYEEFKLNCYIMNNFKIKIVNHTDYALICKRCSIFFIVKRTSENCYQVASVSDYKSEFVTFKKARGVVQYVEDLSRCVEMLDCLKKEGRTFDLTGFTWNLLGFRKLLTGFNDIESPEKSINRYFNDDNFKHLQDQYHRDLYFRDKFGRKKW